MARRLAGWLGWLVLHQPQTPSPLPFFSYPGLFLLFLRELAPFLPVVLSGFLKTACLPSAVDHHGKTPGQNLTTTLLYGVPPPSPIIIIIWTMHLAGPVITQIVRRKRRITLFSGRSKHSKITRLTIHRTKNHGFGPGVGGRDVLYSSILRYFCERTAHRGHYLNLCRRRYPCTLRPRGIDTH